MNTPFESYLYQPSVILSVVGFILAAVGTAAALAFIIPNVSRLFIPSPKATRLGDHIKFIGMDKDRRTIIGEDNMHTVVLSVRGVDLRFNETAQQQQYLTARENWLDQMSKQGVRVRIFMIRDRLPRAANYKNNHGIMARVSQTWAKNLPKALSTEYYITLTHQVKGGNRETLEEAVEQTKSILSDYQVTELVDNLETAENVEDGVDLEEIRYEKLTPAAFYGRMLAPVSRPVPFTNVMRGNLSYAITTDNMKYDSDLGMFEFSSGREKRFAATFVIEEWPITMSESYMLELMSNAVEMTICHDVVPMGKTKAMAEIAWKSKLAPGLNPGSDSSLQFADVEAALQPGSEEEQELFSVQTLITVFGDTPDDVIKARSIINQMRSVGISPVWPKYTMVQHWFSQFPGFDAQSRSMNLLTGEIGILSPFHLNPTGELNSDWGQGPIAMFQTIEGAPYSFQFHAPGGGSPALGHCVSIGPSGAGKAQPLDAKVLTPTGWSTMGQMKVGSLVRTPDGRTSQVTGVFPQGELMSYEIEFADGRKVESCGEHLWKVWNPGNARYEIHTLNKVHELLNLNKERGRNISIPLMDYDAAELPEKELPIHPYALGFYLGDGTTRSGGLRITTADPEHAINRLEECLSGYHFKKLSGNNYDYYCVMSNADQIETIGGKIPTSQVVIKHEGISQSLKNWAAKTGNSVDRLCYRYRNGWNPAQILGFETPPAESIRQYEVQGEILTAAEISDCYGTYHQKFNGRINQGWTIEQALDLSERPERHWRVNPIVNTLKDLGLYGLKSDEKFIPEAYMQGSVSQRLELIRALIDTDGSAERSGLEFSTTSKKLAKQVQILAWSLGARAKIASRITSYTDKSGTKKSGKPSWRVRITSNDLSQLVSLPRKGNVLNRTTEARLEVKSIKEVGKKPMQCIAIDHPDHLYITDDYVVTHNTTLITFLASMALRHPDLKTFFFDRGRGCEVVTKALDGAYLFFDNDQEKSSVALNPLQIEDNGENRQFLQEWLRLIGDVKEDDYEFAGQISDAVELIFDPQIERRYRNLRHLYTTMFPAKSELRERFTAWTNPSQYGSIVCAPEDALDISQRVGGFDFTNILADQKLGPAMVSYLMHRILVEAKGDPRLIFIDETEPLLRNEIFQKRYRKLLQEGRKERQVIISCFQRPTAPQELGLGDVIRGQCPTIFFFRNPAAEEEDYADWRLTQRELDFVLGKSYKKKKYAVLVKRYGEIAESVILDTNLSALGPLMNIYHSGRKQVMLMEEMERLYGKDVVDHYISASS